MSSRVARPSGDFSRVRLYRLQLVVELRVVEIILRIFRSVPPVGAVAAAEVVAISVEGVAVEGVADTPALPALGNARVRRAANRAGAPNTAPPLA